MIASPSVSGVGDKSLQRRIGFKSARLYDIYLSLKLAFTSRAALIAQLAL